MLQEDQDQARERMLPAALVCSVLANINRDADKRPEPYTAADFMPGAKTDEEEMQEFAERVMRGDTFETDPDDLQQFKRQMLTTFGNIRTDA
jgi:hypothetical protein